MEDVFYLVVLINETKCRFLPQSLGWVILKHNIFNNFKSNLKQSNNAIKQWPVYIPIQSFCSDLLMGNMVHEIWIDSYENIIFLLK